MRARHLTILAAIFVSLALQAQSSDVTKEKPEPFYTRDEAPHLEKVLPPPPELTSARFSDDWNQYLWGKSMRDTDRGILAVRDAGISATYFMKRYSEAVGRELTPEKYPELWRLLYRAHRTEQEAGYSAKKYFARKRPYQQFRELSGKPEHESATDFTSYPSGHTHAAWLTGLILTSIDPEHTEDIMKVAYEIGQSRVILGFHYQSDVDAGRVAGSITFARIQSCQDYQKLLAKAIKEYHKNTEK